MRRDYLDVGTRQAHYLHHGRGDPLFLIHHVGRSSELFRPVMAALGTHCHAIAMDLPGYGQSDDPPVPLSIDAAADWVVQFADRLGVERFDVFGMNTGAAIAVSLAAHHADRVKRLGLMALPIIHSERERAQAESRITAARAPRISADGHELVEWWLAYGIEPWRDAATRLGLDLTVDDGSEFASQYLLDLLRCRRTWNDGRRATFAYDAVPRLARVSVPTLVVVPEPEDDGLDVPGFVRTGREVAALIEGAHDAHLPGGNSPTSIAANGDRLASILIDFFFAATSRS